jgi:predicted ATP-dependent serine protease
LPIDLVVFGEVGLAGEIRPVPNGEERLREAAKHGFKQRHRAARQSAPTRRTGGRTGGAWRQSLG